MHQFGQVGCDIILTNDIYAAVLHINECVIFCICILRFFVLKSQHANIFLQIFKKISQYVLSTYVLCSKNTSAIFHIFPEYVQFYYSSSWLYRAPIYHSFLYRPRRKVIKGFFNHYGTSHGTKKRCSSLLLIYREKFILFK